MHSISWPTLLASAGVALVTTLIVEHLAKPWLGARKERILDKDRQQRSALTNFRRAINLANKLMVFKGYPPQLAGLMDEQLKRSTTDLQEYTLSAFEFIPAQKSVSREWEYVLSSMNAYATALPVGLQYMPDDFWESFEVAFSQMTDFLKLLRTSKRHPRRRRELIRKIASSPAPSTFISARESLPN